MFDRIENVVFDFGGVLVDLHYDRCLAVFRRLGYPQAERLFDLDRPAAIADDLGCGRISTHELCDYIRRDSGLPIGDEEVRKGYLALIGTIPVEKLRAIRALQKAGKRTFALSNTDEIVMPYIREQLFTIDGLQMEDYFEKAYLSFEMNLQKPDPEIFRTMAADAGMIPERTLFIDDNLRNVESARELGFQVFWAEPGADFLPLLHELTGRQ